MNEVEFMEKEYRKKLGHSLKELQEVMRNSDVYKDLIKDGIRPHRAFLLSVTFTVSRMLENVNTSDKKNHQRDIGLDAPLYRSRRFIDAPATGSAQVGSEAAVSGGGGACGGSRRDNKE
jgi:hypothetical protein